MNPAIYSDESGFIGQDDMGEFAVQHPEIKRRSFVPQGVDQQGRYTPTIAAEACTELGVDDDQSESADREVAIFYGKLLAATACAMLMVWGLGMYA